MQQTSCLSENSCKVHCSIFILLENKHSYHLRVDVYLVKTQRDAQSLLILQVSLDVFDATMLNVTFTLFTANLLTPNTVSLHSHNLKTTTNLLVNQEDICATMAACAIMRSICNLLSAFLKLHNCSQLLLLYYLILSIKNKYSVSRTRTITTASSKSNISYPFPHTQRKTK